MVLTLFATPVLVEYDPFYNYNNETHNVNNNDIPLNELSCDASPPGYCITSDQIIFNMYKLYTFIIIDACFVLFINILMVIFEQHIFVLMFPCFTMHFIVYFKNIILKIKEINMNTGHPPQVLFLV